MGPHEVLGTAHSERPTALDVCLVAETLARPIRSAQGLRVLADFDFATVPPLDILLIPGGSGTRAVAVYPDALAWIAASADEAEIVARVCTEARIPLAARRAVDRRITPHHSAGVSAGIDMTLWLVGRICDPVFARSITEVIEYSPAATDAHS